MQQAHMMLLQTHFLFELTIKSILGRLLEFDAALRKLPRTLANALRPQQLALGITNYDPDIKPETLGVNHARTTF
jgi:hypothetical protein